MILRLDRIAMELPPAKEPTGLVADLEEQTKRSTKKASSRTKARA